MSIIWSNRNLVCSQKFCLSILSIFEITQNYMVIFLKIMRRKQISKISQFFTCKHKINESNAKVPTHYWIVCLYSKNVSFYVFIPDKIFNFFSNMFSTKIIKTNNFTSVTKQSNPMCAYVRIFIKIYYVSPIPYFLDRLFLE